MPSHSERGYVGILLNSYIQLQMTPNVQAGLRKLSVAASFEVLPDAWHGTLEAVLGSSMLDAKSLYDSHA